MAGPALAQTSLTLAVTGQALVAPDEVTASLTASGSSRDLARAQDAVNVAMTAALKEARGVAGVSATTGDYSVSQTTPDNASGPVTYEASQELDLAMAAPGGQAGAAFTALVGRLQARGLALQSFAGGLSADGRRAAALLALADAMKQAKAQAAFLAGQLGESVGRVENVTVAAPDGGPVAMALPMGAARAFAAPVAAPADVAVSADVTVVVALVGGHS